jgi:hypothetical protein
MACFDHFRIYKSSKTTKIRLNHPFWAFIRDLRAKMTMGFICWPSGIFEKNHPRKNKIRGLVNGTLFLPTSSVDFVCILVFMFDASDQKNNLDNYIFDKIRGDS